MTMEGNTMRELPVKQRDLQTIPPSPVSLRAIFLGLLLIPVNTFMLLHIESIRHQAYPTAYSLFGNVIAFLLMLVLLNALLKRWAPHLALTPGELVVCYVVLCAASSVGEEEMGFLLVGMMGHPFWFDSPENRWAELFGGSLPRWLTVQDKNALRGFYMGSDNFWRPEYLSAWLPPMSAWMAFLLALIWVMICLNALLRRPWTEHQRLSYPLVILPLQMVEEKGKIWHDKLMWLGLGLTGVIDLVNGFSVLFPVIPLIPRHIDLAPYLPEGRPWSAFLAFPKARVPFGIYPFTFGLGLLMPLDLCFSCWLFYLLVRLQAVVGAALGWDIIPGFPFDAHQAWGAYMGIFLYALWRLREPLADAFRKAFGHQIDVNGGQEPLSYREAFIGLFIGIVFLCLFSAQAGMSFLIALTFFTIYFAFSIALTRVRVEAGVPAHDVYLGGPEILLVDIFGSQRLSKKDLIVLSLFFWFNRQYNAHPMPHQLEGFRLGTLTGLSLRGLAGAMTVGAWAGFISASLVMLSVMYQMGAATGKVQEVITVGGEAWRRLGLWLSGPFHFNWHANIARVIGIAVTLALFSIRGYGLWCPLHPLGYAIAGSWSMYKTWSSLFFSWLCKWMALRYGGRRAFDRMANFGKGMVLGDCIFGTLWAIVGAAKNTWTFNPWP